MTTSHLRFSDNPIKSAYLINKADFVACHQFPFMRKVDILKIAKPGATFLLNAPYGADEVWNHLPIEVQEEIISKKLKFYTINAVEVARETGMGQRINTVMQTCFFAISNILPKDEAIAQIKNAIKKTYSKKATPSFRKTSRPLTPLWLICTKLTILTMSRQLSTALCRFRPTRLNSLKS